MNIYCDKNLKSKKLLDCSRFQSRKNIKVGQVALSFMLGLAASQGLQEPVKGIVINDTAGATTAQSLGSPFTAVTDILFKDFETGEFYSDCTGSLIADTYVLTAQHCVQGFFSDEVSVSFRGDDSENSILANISVTNIFQDDTFGLLDGTDIAILELAEAAPNSIDPLKLFGFNPEDLVGSDATLVGFGDIGLGSFGSSFNEAGVRWGAENTIDFFGGAFDPFFNDTFGSNIFNLDFDDGTDYNNTLSDFDSSSSPLANEGTAAVGDSGSPLLVEVNGELLIAGVLSGGSTDTNEFGDISWFTGVTEHREFIELFDGQFVGDFIPLPPPIEPDEPEPVYGIKNGSFENGLDSWSVLGAATMQDSNLGTPPSDGEYNALILNERLAVPDYEIEEFLGLAAGSLEDLSGSFPYEGSAIKQTFTANAGDILTFDFNFLTNECTSFAVEIGECQPGEIVNDFSFVSLSGADSYLDLLANTSSDFIPSETYFFDETGYQSFSYEIAKTGTYTLGFGVADAEDFDFDSGLLVDNVTLTASASTPEPTTTIGLFATAFGAFSLLKRKRK